MHKKITVNPLDSKSWADFSQSVTDYEQWLRKAASEFVERCGEEGVKIATVNFENAVYAGAKDFTVNVTPTRSGSDMYSAEIIAEGESVLFIEFGTGISFANSHQFDYGFAPGSYGKGQGLNPKGWLYKGVVGDNPPFGTEESTKKEGMVHTYGNPANASMLEMVNDLERKLGKIAEEVFG